MTTNKIFKIDYFGFVYQWTDSKRKMKYIGSHYGSAEDSYKGSNVRFQRAIKKRPNDFIREILEYILIDSVEELLKSEQKWLDSVENIKDNPLYYNQKNEAKGGWSFITSKHVKKRSVSLKKKHKKKGLSKKEKDSYKNKIQQRLDRIQQYGFTEKEKQQHSKYSYQIKVIDINGKEFIFESCAKATEVLNIDAQYGLHVCTKKDEFKGYKFIKLRDPVIDCRGIR